jgi:hypothetical protein
MFTAMQLTKYLLNTFESSKGEETIVSILRNKKLVFGCEHFVPRFGPTRSKTNIRYLNVVEELTTTTACT